MDFRFRLGIALVATAAFTGIAHGDDARAGSIVVSDAWARPTAAGMPMGVAYFLVHSLDSDDFEEHADAFR